MAHNDWNSLDKTTRKFNEIYCVFLDILGYKNKSEEFFENKFNLLERIERALESTKKAIKISSIFIDMKDIEISFFSDSIIITTSQEKNNLYKILHYSRILATYLSYEGLFLRGGISEGKHLETTTKTGSPFLASEALQKAYLLESKCAINPRILIDDSIVNKATEEEKKLIFKENKEYVLDYAPMIINEKGNNENDVYLEMVDILEYKENADSVNVKDKYEWILDYYYWKIKMNGKFNINRFSEFTSGKNRGFRKKLK